MDGKHLPIWSAYNTCLLRTQQSLIHTRPLPSKAPELCQHEIEMHQKRESMENDPRGEAKALASYRKYRDAHCRIKYDQSVDVYAFGMVMYELLTHLPPWQTEHDTHALYKKVANGDRPQYGVEEDYKDQDELSPFQGWTSLMEKCWADDSQKRPEFTSIRG